MPKVNWAVIGQLMGNRTARQCRERYHNYLSPAVKLSPWSCEEDQLLLEKYRELGPKWSQMTAFFENRTAVSLKNHYAKLSQATEPVRRPPHLPGEPQRDGERADPVLPVSTEPPATEETPKLLPPQGVGNIFQAIDRVGEEWFNPEAEIKYTSVVR
jgi:hypothetical protein